MIRPDDPDLKDVIDRRLRRGECSPPLDTRRDEEPEDIFKRWYHRDCKGDAAWRARFINALGQLGAEYQRALEGEPLRNLVTLALDTDAPDLDAIAREVINGYQPSWADRTRASISREVLRLAIAAKIYPNLPHQLDQILERFDPEDMAFVNSLWLAVSGLAAQNLLNAELVTACLRAIGRGMRGDKNVLVKSLVRRLRGGDAAADKHLIKSVVAYDAGEDASPYVARLVLEELRSDQGAGSNRFSEFLGTERSLVRWVPLRRPADVALRRAA